MAEWAGLVKTTELERTPWLVVTNLLFEHDPELRGTPCRNNDHTNNSDPDTNTGAGQPAD